MIPVTPETGESLIGFVARTCSRNWLKKLRPILSVCGAAFHMHQNLAISDAVDFAKLALTCRVDPDEIESRRYLRLDDDLTGMPGMSFHGTAIPPYDLDLRRRVTPSWLRKGFHPALGHHGLITHCPETGEVIIDRCPRCDKRLNWTKSAIERCQACGYDLSRHQGKLVSDDQLVATRVMIDLIHPDPSCHASALSSLPREIRDFDRGLLFETGWRMGCLISGQGQGDRDRAKALPFEKRLDILAKGSAALLNWPHSFTDALVGRAPGLSGSSTELAAAAQEFTSVRSWWPGLGKFFRVSVPNFEIGRLQAVKAALQLGVNSAQLEATLGVSQRIVDRLRKTVFTPVISRGQSNLHQIFEGAELADLRSRFEDLIPLGSVAERLSISRHGVEQLACLGEITTFDDGPVKAGFRQRQVRLSDFELLLQRLQAESSDVPEEDQVPVRNAMKLVGGREKPWGPLVVGMVSGSIAYGIMEGSGRLMTRIVVRKGELDEITNLRFETSEFPGFSFESRINRRDSEEALNINPRSFSQALKDGAITRSEDGLYDRKTILALSLDHISLTEVLARWSSEDDPIPQTLLRENNILKRNLLGWDRAEVEKIFA